MLISFVESCNRHHHISFHHFLLSCTFATSSLRYVKKRMPPKKQAQAEKKILLGRPSNNLKIGIVGAFMTAWWTFFVEHPTDAGLPNVGKSSFFNALSETGTCNVFLLMTKYRWVPCRSWQGCELSICYDQSGGSSHTCARFTFWMALPDV